MANYFFSVDGPETGSVGPGEFAIVNNLAFFDTTDTVTGAANATLGFGIAGNLALDLTGYGGITGFGIVNAQATGSVDLTIAQDFYDANVTAGAHLIIQGTAQGGSVTLDAGGLTGQRPVDLISFSAANDVLTGGGGGDNLYGGAGADQLNGGAGFDLARYDNATGVVANLQTGVNQGDAQGDVYSSIEGLVGSGSTDTLTGDGTANFLFGAAGDDVLTGGAGADVLDGGEGIRDTVDYTVSTSLVVVDISLGTGRGGDAEGDTLSGIERVRGSAFDDTLIGDGAANLFVGVAGADRLSGGGGDDLLVGDSSDLADASNDILIGGAGADALYGGSPGLGSGDTGIDAADYSASAAGVSVDLISGTGHGGEAEGDTLFQIDNLVGSALADRLIAGAGVNVLTGGAGDDALHGGAGADTLEGGDGIDQADYRGSTAGVTVDLLAHTGSGGDAQGDVLTGIENLFGSSFDDHLTGDDGRTILGGGNGADTLAGNGGDDSLAGEAGDDSLDGGDGNDRLIGGAGVDTIHGGIGNDSIDGGSENDVLFGEDGNDTIVGGAGNDQIDAGIGNDIVEGGAGADAITGGAGSDTAYYSSSASGVTVNLAAGTASGGDAQGDTLTGIEQLYGSGGADVLTGDASNNALWGGAGGDVLTGGVGADALKGGAGSDFFVYASVADSTVAAAGKDTIADFSTGDRIDLSAIDADGNASNGNTAFTFGTGNFTGAGQLRVVDFGDGRQGVYLDINGDKNPDSIIAVLSDHALTASDFVL